MGHQLLRRTVPVLALVTGAWAIVAPARAEFTRTQTITLAQGWNAVFLEVDPPEPEPGRVFADTPVDVVAAYFARTAAAQFVSDPETDLFRELGWGVWYAESRPDAFLKTLHAIYGGQAYLVHATRAHTWTVTGEAVRSAVEWRPDSYNLVGFSVAEQGAPTFAQFFAGSKAHRGQPVYRLAGDRWRRVARPETETMKAGEAFWIYCNGGSDYPGPLGVETEVSPHLVVSAGEARVVLRNYTDHPLAPTLEQIVSPGKSQPLSILIEVVGDPEKPFQKVAAPKPAGAWQQALPPLEAGKAVAVPFVARLEEITVPEQRSLLKVVSDLGTVHWVPVICRREDLDE